MTVEFLPLDGLENMRLDSALLARAELGEIGWRAYGWDGVWVSVGRFESVERDLVDPAAIRWVRRPTGGKAVLHGHDVTVAVAVPLSVLPHADPRSIRSAYRCVVQPLVSALGTCGPDAALAVDTVYAGRGTRSGDCFAYSSPNDIVDLVNGRKMCGCALRLTQAAVLLQASIPVGEPLVQPESVIVNAVAIRPSRIDADAFVEALRTAIRVAW